MSKVILINRVACPLAAATLEVSQLPTVPDAGQGPTYGLFASHNMPLTVSPHFNRVCNGSFASVLGTDHDALVAEAIADLIRSKPTIH